MADLRHLNPKQHRMEYAYQLLLQTYLAKENERNACFQQTCDFLKHNPDLYFFELACLYNNWGVSYESQSPEIAYTYYKEGLNTIASVSYIVEPFFQSPDVIIMNLTGNIRDLFDKSTWNKEKYGKDLLRFINNLRASDSKIIIVSQILWLDIFDYDVRKKHQLLSLLFTEINKIQSQTLFLAILETIVDQQEKLENNADAELLLKNAYDLCLSKGWKSLALLTSIKNYTLNASSENSTFLHDSIQNKVNELLRSRISNYIKIHYLLSLAKVCIQKKYIDDYSKILEKLKGTPLFSEFSVRAVEQIFCPAIENNMDNKDAQLIRIIQKIDNSVIQEISSHVRATIAEYLKNIDKDLAHSWNPEKKSIYSQIVQIDSILREKKISRGTAITSLDKIIPAPFTIGGHSFTKEDARILISLRKLEILMNDEALEKYVKYRDFIKTIENTLPLASSLFLELFQDRCLLSVGLAYLEIGEIEKAAAYLPKCKVEAMGSYPLWLYSMGSIYRLRKDYKKAIKYLSEAKNAYAQKKDYSNWINSAYDLLTSMLKDEQPYEAMSPVIKEMISIAEKHDCGDMKFYIYLASMKVLWHNRRKLTTEKKEEMKRLSAICIADATDPYFLSDFYCTSAMIKNDQNYPAKEVSVDIERYYQYLSLYSNILPVLNEQSEIFTQYVAMKNLLFNNLEEMQDSKKIDYWSKMVERDKNFFQKIHDGHSHISADMVSLISLVSKFEHAQQILVEEETKPEKLRDKLLIQKALLLRRELEQQFEHSRKKIICSRFKVFG